MEKADDCGLHPAILKEMVIKQRLINIPSVAMHSCASAFVQDPVQKVCQYLEEAARARNDCASKGNSERLLFLWRTIK